jgi:Protein DA1
VHVWVKLRQDMPHPLPPAVEEGLCQFVSIKYLESLDSEGSRPRPRPAPSEVRSEVRSAQSTSLPISSTATSSGGTIAVRGDRDRDREGDPRNPLSYLGHCVETKNEKTHQRQEPRRSSYSSSAASASASASETQEDKVRRRLRAYFRFAIETDESPVYGRGYRDAARCVSELTLDVVLDHVKTTSSLPVV